MQMRVPILHPKWNVNYFILSAAAKADALALETEAKYVSIACIQISQS